MALDDLERKRRERVLAAFVERRRPPAHLRKQVDLGFRIAEQSVEIFEIRAQWDRPDVKRESSIAKATFVGTHSVWRVFWKRADLKWHRYEPAPEVGSLEAFVQLVDEDEHCCFWG